ncbi:hypothetical protein [Sphingomonas gellani]|uniref:hypothetical protein n=1 Tax=Sphingomonas gellani TaxID=1166340 RepID=UPI001FCD4203|nr:hypothetical protein [Sphingomonas gellani]
MLTELLYIAAGLLIAAAVAGGAAWAYPLGGDVIWGCGVFAMVATVLMGIAPLRRAVALDRETR